MEAQHGPALSLREQRVLGSIETVRTVRVLPAQVAEQIDAGCIALATSLDEAP
ncbi:hypothetical protein [Streptacidiphilus neutrinimicus]|uniref:hypothetical protein n=1 Tax=Streptacidiphilus neutrinimicus TaxID=105420 RepID=UPI000B1A2A46|nr:hypothetical protein [Streptacidiphilus neutrinimicus]